MSAVSCDIDAQAVIATSKANFCRSNTSCRCSVAPSPAVVVVGRSIDGDDIVSGASINVGIECTECADIALARGISVDKEAVVTAA